MLPDHEAQMISDIGVEAQMAVEAWRDATNQTDIDPDSNLTDLVPVMGRLLGWLSEPETCERRGMRVTALLECVRPDLNGGRSLAQLSPTSKQNLSKLCVNFRETFSLHRSAHQIAKVAKYSK
jgi:alkylhydroperoxidase family enzyme